MSDTPRAGDAFFGGFVCYAKEFKERILGCGLAVRQALVLALKALGK